MLRCDPVATPLARIEDFETDAQHRHLVFHFERPVRGSLAFAAIKFFVRGGQLLLKGIPLSLQLFNPGSVLRATWRGQDSGSNRRGAALGRGRCGCRGQFPHFIFQNDLFHSQQFFVGLQCRDLSLGRRQLARGPGRFVGTRPGGAQIGQLLLEDLILQAQHVGGFVVGGQGIEPLLERLLN